MTVELCKSIFLEHAAEKMLACIVAMEDTLASRGHRTLEQQLAALERLIGQAASHAKNYATIRRFEGDE